MRKCLILTLVCMLFLTACGHTSASDIQEPESQPPIETKDFMSMEEIEKINQAVLAKANNDLPCEQLITKRYPIERICPSFHILPKTYASNLISGDGTRPGELFKTEEGLGIECLRKMENGNHYAVFEVEEGGRVFYFYSQENRESHAIYVNKPGKEEDYDNLKVGDYIDKLFDIDYSVALGGKLEEGGGRWMNYTGFDESGANEFGAFDFDFRSLHLLENVLIMIQWDAENGTLKKVEKFPDRKIKIKAGVSVNVAPGTALLEEDEVFDFTILPQDYPQ